MKVLKKILWITFGITALFLIFLVWYENKYSMDTVTMYEVNSPRFQKKLLIATQGSDFKNTITDGVINHYKLDAIYIKVIDIGELSEIDPNDYDAILVMHTWENWKPPVAVKYFIERTKNHTNKIMVLTTSGEGSYKMENVDAITGESILENARDFTDQIISRTDKILEYNKSP